jgi:tRNA/tmRNA/rRNA uracil-C5-methylase (TrmA/RlmC/RlmD family)
LDQIPDSLRQWKQYGYKVQRIVVLDMFPGTAGLEVLILLSRP